MENLAPQANSKDPTLSGDIALKQEKTTALLYMHYGFMRAAQAQMENVAALKILLDNSAQPAQN